MVYYLYIRKRKEDVRVQRIAILSGDENTTKICLGFLRLSGFDSIAVSETDTQILSDAAESSDLCVVDEDRCYILDRVTEINKPAVVMCESDRKYPCPYIRKPFSMAALLQKIHELLKDKSAEKPSSPSGIEINEDKRQVILNGEEIAVTGKEFEILICLMENSDTVFSREELINKVWGGEFDGEIRTVDSHMARLRTKLKEWGEEHIKTVYGKGYIFNR